MCFWNMSQINNSGLRITAFYQWYIPWYGIGVRRETLYLI
jgi:hypothetical protein